jgi:hypothetical protein
VSTKSQAAGRSGRRVLFVVYAGIVGVAAAMGFVLGLINPQGLDPVLYGFIDLPPTPLGMAVFGIGTIGLGLGVLLAIVAFVAARFDDDAV